jgi:hypothetical protein
MTVLPGLERLLGDAAERLATPLEPTTAGADAPRRTATRSRRHRRAAVVFAVLALGGTTVALAAAGVFEPGTPVGPQPGYAPVAGEGFGALVAGSVRLSALRVPDPAGGPAWGVALFRTTRGVVCPAAGRLVGGRIGVLGTDYAFADDGRFHSLEPSTSIDLACLPPDARGHAFLTGEGGIVNASGDIAPAAAISQRPHCDLPGEHDWGVRCPQSALRTVYFGFLGPAARSVSYTVAGVRHVEQVSGENGAYLVVLDAPPGSTVGRRANLGGFKPGPTLYATYAGGRRCAVLDVLEVAGPGECALVGYVQASAALPAPAAIATQAAISYHASLRYGPLRLPGLLVTFVARVPVADTQSNYAVTLGRPHNASCTNAFARSNASHRGEIPLEQPTDRNIAAGQTVSLVVPLQPLCAGRYVGRLYFYRDTSPYNAVESELGVSPGTSLPTGVTVSRLAIDVP